jgi:phosphoglycolate phosphatase
LHLCQQGARPHRGFPIPEPGLLILWDLDGTLISSPPARRQHYQEAVALLLGRSEVEPPEWTSGGTDFGIVERLLRREGFDRRGAAILVPAALQILEDLSCDLDAIAAERQILPGAVDALVQVSQGGALQTLVTGNTPRRALAKLNGVGLDADFDLRFGAFGDRTRDRVRLVHDARTRAGLLARGDRDAIRPGRTVVIGDTVHDVRAAQGAGCVAIAVATGQYTADQLAEADADLIIDDLAGGSDDIVRFLNLLATDEDAATR